MKKFRVGLVQLCSSRNVEANLNETVKYVEQAAALGADYVQTPENTTLMETDHAALFAGSLEQEALSTFSSLARRQKIWLHIGSMTVRSGDRLANRSFLFSPEGTLTSSYDKIHLFDVQVPNGESYLESRDIIPGNKAVLAKLPWGSLGISICYDVRFPQLYRALAQAGADCIAVPAAFTRQTGEAHWETLLRARAIENQSWVFAAAQCGDHECGRKTFGHSMIISPWGEIIAEAGTKPTVIVAEVDLEVGAEIRQKMPCLAHDKAFTIQK